MDSWKKDSRREAVITDIDALNLPSLAVAACAAGQWAFSIKTGDDFYIGVRENCDLIREVQQWIRENGSAQA